MSPSKDVFTFEGTYLFWKKKTTLYFAVLTNGTAKNSDRTNIEMVASGSGDLYHISNSNLQIIPAL